MFKRSYLYVIKATDGSRSVIVVDFLDLELFPMVGAEFVVQNSIHIDGNITLLGCSGHLEEFLFSSVLGRDAAFLVELAQVVDIVNVVSDTLQSS